MRILIKTFGCKTNYADSVEIARGLHQYGIFVSLAEEHKNFENRDNYAVIIVNSCVVTNEAEAEARRFISKVRRKHQNAEIILTGCGARGKNTLPKFSQLSIHIVGDISSVPKRALEILREMGHNVRVNLPSREASREPQNECKYFNPPRARYFLKVQDGCNSGCSFCIIPQTRSLESKNIKAILNEVELTTTLGTAEIVVTGVNVGLYREPKYGFSLAELLARILQESRNRFRVRLSSIEPEHVNENILNLFGHPKMCPHLHLPLQSGSNRVLADMRRKYDVRKYLKIVDSFRRKYPYGAVSADIMVGYPTETEEDFQETLKVVRECAFERVHIFPYSERPGTLSAFSQRLNGKIVSDREARLFELSREVARDSLKRFLDRRAEVIPERRDGSFEGLPVKLPNTQPEKKEEKRISQTTLSGYGEAYQRVHFQVLNHAHLSSFAYVKLKELRDREFIGELIPSRV